MDVFHAIIHFHNEQKCLGVAIFVLKEYLLYNFHTTKRYSANQLDIAIKSNQNSISINYFYRHFNYILMKLTCNEVHQFCIDLIRNHKIHISNLFIFPQQRNAHLYALTYNKNQLFCSSALA